MRDNHGRSPTRRNDGMYERAGDTRLPSSHLIGENDPVLLYVLRNPTQ